VRGDHAPDKPTSGFLLPGSGSTSATGRGACSARFVAEACC